jgi:hypothetical protein
MSIINFTNHPSDMWDDEQRDAALAYGEIIDVQFPDIEATLDEYKIERLAEEYVDKIVEMHPSAVICQGEFTFVYAVVNLLRVHGIHVFAACSKRQATQTLLPDGSTKKAAIFKFVRFREYK